MINETVYVEFPLRNIDFVKKKNPGHYHFIFFSMKNITLKINGNLQ